MTVAKSNPAGQNQSSAGLSEYSIAELVYTLNSATAANATSITSSMPNSAY